jgi:hypothetical protein
MDADAVRIVARKELIARTVELFAEIIGLTHEDVFVRDLVHLIGVAVCNNVHRCFFFEQRRHRVDYERIFLSGFAGKCYLCYDMLL